MKKTESWKQFDSNLNKSITKKIQQINSTEININKNQITIGKEILNQNNQLTERNKKNNISNPISPIKIENNKVTKTTKNPFKRKTIISSSDIQTSNLQKHLSTLNSTLNKTESQSKNNESVQNNLNQSQKENNSNLFKKRMTMHHNQSNLQRKSVLYNPKFGGIKSSEKRLMIDSLLIPKTVNKEDKKREKVEEANIILTDSQNILATSQSLHQTKSSNIKVIIRFRPQNEVEKEFLLNNIGFTTCEFPKNEDNSVFIKTDPNSNSQSTTHQFRYDKVFKMETKQDQIYDYIGKETLRDVCNGYNGTIFSYGQSGSGKTFTMYGNDIYDDVNKGIIPRLVDNLFSIIEESNEDIVFQLKFSIMQIYKEVIYDLLTGEKDLKVKESPVKGIYVEGLSEIYIDNTDTFLELLQMSQEQRVVAGTKLNQYSSRSHTIFMLEVLQTCPKQDITKRGMLNLVDLAGTEKVSKTGAVGDTLEEAKKINLSLSALGNVIHSLTSGADHIPYRDSKLTRILQESLGGNYKTSLIVACSPHSYHMEETISSLKFAQRVKTIKNKIKMNIKLSYEQMQKLNSNLKLELELAVKEINCLKDLLKDSSKVGENIIDLLQTQNDKNFIQNEIQNSHKKLINAKSGNNNNTFNKGNINIVNNSNASSLNLIFPMNSKEEIDSTIKKINLMNRRSSFLDSNVKNNLKKLLVFNGKDFKNLDKNIFDNEEIKSNNSSNNSNSSENSQSATYANIISPEDSSSDSGILQNKKYQKYKIRNLNKQIQSDKKKIKELEEKIENLTQENLKKDILIKESNKDILKACRDVYDKFFKEVKLNKNKNNFENIKDPFIKDISRFTISAYESKTETISPNKINNEETPLNNFIFNNLDTPNLEIVDLCNHVTSTLNSYDNLLNILNENKYNKNKQLDLNLFTLNSNNKNLNETTFNFDKIKSFLQINNYDSENKILSSLFNQIDKDENFTINLVKCLKNKLSFDLLDNFNKNILNQNKIINSQNNILVNLFGEMISLNQILIQRLEKNPMRSLSQNNNENILNILDQPRNLSIPNNKISKFLTKKNVNLLKVANMRRFTLESNGLLNSILQFQQNNQNLIENFNNESIENNLNSNSNMKNNNSEKSERSSILENNHKKSFLNNNSNNLFNQVIKSIDRCNEQFTSLKDFIFKSFKESENIKNNFEVISKDLNYFENLYSNKFTKQNLIFENTEDNESISKDRNSEIDYKNINLNCNSRNLINVNILKKSKFSIFKGGMIKLDQVDENEECEYSSMNNQTLNSNKTFKSLSTHNKNKINFKINKLNTDENLEDSYKREVYSNFKVNKTIDGVQKMFKKYSVTGSASK